MQVAIRERLGEPKKGWFRVVFLIVLWLLIISMLRDYGRIQSGFERKREVESRLVEFKAKNEVLKRELEQVGSLAFKEKVTRESLNMQKKGEVVVVLPDLTITSEYRISQESNYRKDVWHKWLDLIVY